MTFKEITLYKIIIYYKNDPRYKNKRKILLKARDHQETTQQRLTIKKATARHLISFLF